MDLYSLYSVHLHKQTWRKGVHQSRLCTYLPGHLISQTVPRQEMLTLGRRPKVLRCVQPQNRVFAEAPRLLRTLLMRAVAPPCGVVPWRAAVRHPSLAPRRCRSAAAAVRAGVKAAMPAAKNSGNLLSLVIVDHPLVRSALPLIGNLAYTALAGGFLMTDILSLRCLLVCGARRRMAHSTSTTVYPSLLLFMLLQRLTSAHLQ